MSGLNKHDLELEHYACIPHTLLDNEGMKLVDKLLMAVLYRIAGNKVVAWPSREYLARKVGCSVREISRSLRRLEESGWIKTERQMRGSGAQTSNIYTLRRPLEKVKAHPVDEDEGGLLSLPPCHTVTPRSRSIGSRSIGSGSRSI